MPRSGDLHVTKECSSTRDSPATSARSRPRTSKRSRVGSKVVYADAAGDGTLDTDVVLDAGSGNTAAGHVILDLAADKGVASFSGGTGKFAGFRAHADVSTGSDGLWHWEGTYSFD